MMRLKDKVTIVTGGGKGIGKAIALAFAKEGASVVVAARTLANLKDTVDQIKRNKGNARAVQTDVADEKQVERMVAETIRVFGKVDILVNNSGIAGPSAAVVDMNADEWNEVLAIDLTGSMFCCKHVLKHMIPQKGGNIITIVSEAGRAGDGTGGYPMRSAYCCAKMALIGLTETLSVEVGQHNIRVNAISPGAVSGERVLNVFKGRAARAGVPVEVMLSRFLENCSLGRMAEESEVASVAVFLASDESSIITGQTITSHCGLHIAR